MDVANMSVDNLRLEGSFDTHLIKRFHMDATLDQCK